MAQSVTVHGPKQLQVLNSYNSFEMKREKLTYMRRIAISAIKGDEILAQDIISDYNTLLMSAGVVLKKEYVHRLEDMGIQYIYVEDQYAEGIEKKDITEIKIKEQCQKEVQETLDKFVYCGSSELEVLKEVAQEIIMDLLEDPDIMFNVSGVRQKAESVYSHSINVAALTVFLALRMKIPKDKVREIATGTLMHDIGYTYVKTDLRDKKYTDYSDKEKKEIQMHVIYGYSAIEKESWLSNIAKDIILHHHEHVDGTGYPMHIDGEKIKVGTKIAAVCDTFDNLVYGNFAEGMKVHEAIEYIVSHAGTLFDPKVVKVFNTSIAAYPTGSTVLTNEGEYGIVIRQNKELPTRPVLRMIKDKDGKEYQKSVEKDLLVELDLFIEDTL